MKSWEDYDYGRVWMAPLWLDGLKIRPGVSIHDCSENCASLSMWMVPGTGRKKSHREAVIVKPDELLEGKLEKMTYFTVRFAQEISKKELRRYLGRLTGVFQGELRETCKQVARLRKYRR